MRNIYCGVYYYNSSVMFYEGRYLIIYLIVIITYRL